MILVTVGTTIPFDELIEEVDRLAAAGIFREHVICQGGQSSYRASCCEQFMAKPSIDDLIAESSMVITHGGATVIQLLITHKPFVAFPNPRGAGNHQASFLLRISAVTDISWSRNVNDLEQLFRERRSLGPSSIPTNIPRAGNIVRDALYSGAA